MGIYETENNKSVNSLSTRYILKKKEYDLPQKVAKFDKILKHII
jgi:hypothetical protein